MQPIKQFFNNLLDWWKHLFENKKVRNVFIWIFILIISIALYLVFVTPSSAAVGNAFAIAAGTYVGSDTPSGTGLYGSANISFTSNGQTFNNMSFSSGTRGFTIMYGDVVAYDDTLGWYNISYKTIVLETDQRSSLEFGDNFTRNFSLYIAPDPDPDPEPDPDPDPEPSDATFKAGLYKVNQLWYNTTISTQLDGMEFYSLSEGELYTALTVQNNELLVDHEDGSFYPAAVYSTTGVTWLDNSIQFVYFINDENISSSLSEQIPSLLEYIPDVTLADFQRLQDSWYFGLLDGFYTSDQSYDKGFEDGFNQGVENSGGNIFGNFISGILNALDKLVVLPGGISMLDVIKAIGGIFAVVWLLKLLAGG